MTLDLTQVAVPPGDPNIGGSGLSLGRDFPRITGQLVQGREGRKSGGTSYKKNNLEAQRWGALQAYPGLGGRRVLDKPGEGKQCDGGIRSQTGTQVNRGVKG